MTFYFQAELSELIGFMGGFYTKDLVKNGTHLVTNSIISKKYEVAISNKIKVMTSNWIHEVWRKSHNENVLATSSKFNRFKTLPFHNLRITTNGFTERKKKWIKTVIENGGGSYEGGTTDVLICKEDTIKTPKVVAALNARKDILRIEWIEESVKKGYAQPIEEYRINFTDAILRNENAMSKLCISPQNKDLPYKAFFDELNVLDAKKAGSFLVGCNVSYQFI